MSIEAIRTAREEHFPVLWIGIRIGTRSWLGQAAGLAKVIASIHAQFPRLGVVFDGFSLPGDRPERQEDKEYAAIITQENLVVRDILKALEQSPDGVPGFFNIIGSSIFDANLWAHAIDVYVSPYGSLQHKVGWLANRPGIIHTNHACLGRTVIWTVVENACRPRYVSGGAVAEAQGVEKTASAYKEISDLSDIGAGLREADKKAAAGAAAEYDTYELDWEALASDLRALIQIRGQTRSFDWSVSAERAKRSAKEILRHLVGFFDHSII